MVDALDNVSLTATVAGRDILLEGIPRNIVRSFYRYADNKLIDLSKLVEQLDQVGRLDDSGARPLLLFLENARQTTVGSSTGRMLQELIHELEQQDEEDTLWSEPFPFSLPVVPEALIFGGSDERLPFTFFEGAVRVQKSIASLRVPRLFGTTRDSKLGLGTGWLIAPGLLLTNHHVIAARQRNEQAPSPAELHAQAEQTAVWFDYSTEAGAKAECRSVELVYQNADLDYALLQLEQTPLVTERAPLVLARQHVLCQADRLNIVQHPGGGPLKYAIRNNFYIGIGTTAHFIRYLTDTEAGSSGSPVFTDDWLVVALHHAACKIPTEHYKGETVKYHNEGIELRTVLDSLPQRIRQEIYGAQGW